MSLQSDYMSKIAKKIAKEREDIFVEALSKHGYKYDNKQQLLKELKDRIRLECFVSDPNIVTYFIDNKPFIVLDHECKIDIKNEDFSTTANAIYMYKFIDKLE